MPTEITREPDARRYALRVDGELVAVLDYALNGSAISFTRTYTQPKHRGQGFAAQLTAFAVDDIERSGALRIVPMCWYVAEWFEAHPEKAQLLTR